jgi:type III pantothenate kinase
MTPDVVVDVGNSQIKWGRCAEHQIVRTGTLSPEDSLDWGRQQREWELEGRKHWAITGVHPQRCTCFVEWLEERGQEPLVLNDPAQLPLRVGLPHPERVGLDRLLDALAANSRRPAHTSAVIVDAGSAVTVDLVDQEGVFRGGVIFPGFRLMSLALHHHTALLPLVEMPDQAPPLVGTSTTAAIRSGIFRAVAGGIRQALEEMREVGPVVVFLTGGDGRVLHPVLGEEVMYWPEMTLEGIRLAAEALP